MVEKIVYTYKFNTLPNIDSLKEECKIWLTTILDKFEPSKGSKAFSYFSVITKNWFIHKTKKNNISMKREVQINEINTKIEENFLSIENGYLEDREKEEFWMYFWKEVGRWDHLKLKENERKVLDAIKILFETANDIEIFNKKAIYLYIRELTGLNTKQVVNNLNKIKFRYFSFRKKWDNNKIN